MFKQDVGIRVDITDLMIALIWICVAANIIFNLWSIRPQVEKEKRA
jgi:hypothetical protein